MNNPEDVILRDITPGEVQAVDFQAPEPKYNLTAAEATETVNVLAALMPRSLIVLDWAAQLNAGIGSGLYLHHSVATKEFGNQPVRYVALIRTIDSTGYTSESVHELGLIFDRLTSSREHSLQSIVGVIESAFGTRVFPPLENGEPDPRSGQLRLIPYEAVAKLGGIVESQDGGPGAAMLIAKELQAKLLTVKRR